MLLSGAHAPFRRGLALAALALFLSGSNFCLIAGLAAARGSTVPMGCMSVADEPAPASHCGGGGASHCGGGSAAPERAAAAPSPCCVALLPVTPPALDAHAVADAPAPVAIAPALDEPLEPRLAPVVALDAHAPPEAPPGSPLGQRAPPLL
jgi:hypothetical protein